MRIRHRWPPFVRGHGDLRVCGARDPGRPDARRRNCEADPQVRCPREIRLLGVRIDGSVDLTGAHLKCSAGSALERHRVEGGDEATLPATLSTGSRIGVPPPVKPPGRRPVQFHAFAREALASRTCLTCARAAQGISQSGDHRRPRARAPATGSLSAPADRPVSSPRHRCSRSVRRRRQTRAMR